MSKRFNEPMDRIMAGRTDAFAQQLRTVQPNTRDLIASVLMDSWPSPGAIVDFGVDSQQHYEALYYPIRAREIMPTTLDNALGHGERLTALTQAAPSNPHKDLAFATIWDGFAATASLPAAGRASILNEVITQASTGTLDSKQPDRSLEMDC